MAKVVEFSDASSDSGIVVSDSKEEIAKLSTDEGIQRMERCITAARDDGQLSVLSNLLSQCLGINFDNIDLELFLSSNLIPLIRGLKKHANADIKRTAREVIRKWRTIFLESLHGKEVDLKQAPPSLPPSKKLSMNPSIVEENGNSIEVERKRPRTAVVKNSKRRTTGLSGDEAEDEQPPQAKHRAVETPGKKSSLLHSIFSSIGNGFSRSTPQQIRKPVRIVPPSYNLQTSSRKPSYGSDRPLKRKICFADEKNQELVRIKFFDSECENVRRISNMKSADAKREGAVLLSMKNMLKVEDDESPTKVPWNVQMYPRSPAAAV